MVQQTAYVCNGVSATDAGGSPQAGSDAGSAGGTGGAIGCGTGCGARAICLLGACVPARRVFISSTEHNADSLGALAGDNICQNLADLAQLQGIWMAWVSDSITSPSTRFTKATVPYSLLDGTVVASDWTALARGNLAHSIDQDEHGTRLSSSRFRLRQIRGDPYPGADARISPQQLPPTRVSSASATEATSRGRLHIRSFAIGLPVFTASSNRKGSRRLPIPSAWSRRIPPALRCAGSGHSLVGPLSIGQRRSSRSGLRRHGAPAWPSPFGLGRSWSEAESSSGG